MNKILFIDDDKFFANDYLLQLKLHFEVIVCYEADAAVAAFRDNPDIVGAVVDVMMPPPKGREHETHDGYTTGVWVLHECRDAVIGNRIAILLFTNRNVGFVKSETAFLGINPDLCEISAKDAIDEDDLPHTLMKLIARR